jgi:UDP-glucose 4-epimerase
VYIDDLVRFCSIVLGKPMSVGAHIFNACSGTSVSLNDLFGIMESVTGKPLRRSYDAGRSVDASYIAMDAGLAARTYGWRHETSLDEGLKRTWERFDRGKR